LVGADKQRKQQQAVKGAEFMMTQRRAAGDHIGTAVTKAGKATTGIQAKLQEAVQARDTLAVALRRAGIQLPAMDVRTPCPNEDMARYALVHLGVCSAPVAHALAAVITKGADR
jgi:hypothetical protein